MFYYRKQHMAYPARFPINHLKLRKDSAGESVPGTRNKFTCTGEAWNLWIFSHDSIQYTHSNFYNREDSVRWLNAQSIRKLTDTYPLEHTPRLCKKASNSWNYELSTCTAEG